MSSSTDARPGYVVPRYRAPDDAIWYHVLHGAVPGYQIDFMFCPEVPHGAFNQNHFGHLARLMKYIEPRESAPCAFALGNLSRDDVQHVPGHGGLSLILGLRVHGVLDHVGRARPPHAHAIVAVDRALDHQALRDAAVALHRRLLRGGPMPHEDTSGRLYRRYARAVRHQPATVESLLRRHVDGFAELPRPGPSALTWSFFAEDPAPPQRITITHPDDEPFETLANTMARLGAMLYRSNIKWTTISSGREFDIPGGVSVRLVPEGEAIPDPAGLVVPIAEIPGDEAAMARALFGASPRAPVAVPARVGWRALDAARKPAPAVECDRPVPGATLLSATPPSAEHEAPEGDGVAAARSTRTRLLIGVCAASMALCALAAIVATSPAPAPDAERVTAAASCAPEALATSASTSRPSEGGAWSPPRRLDIISPPSSGPRGAVPGSPGRSRGSAAPSIAPSAPPAPRAASAPAAIGGNPRF